MVFVNSDFSIYRYDMLSQDQVTGINLKFHEKFKHSANIDLVDTYYRSCFQKKMLIYSEAIEVMYRIIILKFREHQRSFLLSHPLTDNITLNLFINRQSMAIPQL
jgi:hypothetical protein